MRVGILTFQHSINFGAQLQCLALQELIKREGHQAEVIKYYPIEQKGISVFSGLWIRRDGFWQALRRFLYRVFYTRREKKLISSFQEEYFSFSEECHLFDIQIIAGGYDAIVVGSDQVWGPTFHSSGVYFLEQLSDFKGKRISYAPCCAYNEVHSTNKEKLQQLLSGFDIISVRNNETQDFVKDLIRIVPPIVQDPTFLFDFDCLFTKEFRKPFEKYILTYILGDEIDGGHQSVLKEIKQKVGDIPVVSIVLSTNQTIKHFTWADKTYWLLKPDEWVFLIKNAEYFYTDSFHGVTFSLKYQIPFLAYYAEKLRKARFVDLLERFKLDNYIGNCSHDLIEIIWKQNEIDFTKVSLLIEKENRYSLSFLYNALL